MSVKSLYACLWLCLLLWSVSPSFFFIRFLFFYFLEKHKNVHLLHIICYICSFHMSRISSYYLLLQFSIFDNYLLNQYLTRLQNMHTNEHLYTIRIAWNIWAVLYISWYWHLLQPISESLRNKEQMRKTPFKCLMSNRCVPSSQNSRSVPVIDLKTFAVDQQILSWRKSKLCSCSMHLCCATQRKICSKPSEVVLKYARGHEVY